MAYQLNDTLALRSRGRVLMTSVGEVRSILSKDNYSEVTLADGTSMVVRRTLKAWEDALPSSYFLRVRRTLIVNLARITRYERDGEEHTRLYLIGTPEPVSASRRTWPKLRASLQALRPAP